MANSSLSCILGVRLHTFLDDLLKSNRNYYTQDKEMWVNFSGLFYMKGLTK